MTKESRHEAVITCSESASNWTYTGGVSREPPWTALFAIWHSTLTLAAIRLPAAVKWTLDGFARPFMSSGLSLLTASLNSDRFHNNQYVFCKVISAVGIKKLLRFVSGPEIELCSLLCSD